MITLEKIPFKPNQSLRYNQDDFNLDYKDGDFEGNLHISFSCDYVEKDTSFDHHFGTKQENQYFAENLEIKFIELNGHIKDEPYSIGINDASFFKDLAYAISFFTVED